LAAALGAVAAAVVAAALGGAAPAAADGASAEQASGTTVVQDPAKARDIARSLSPGEMRRAKPLDVELRGKGRATRARLGAKRRNGPAVGIPPSRPSGDAKVAREPRSYVPYDEYEVPFTSYYPFSTNGKVFFKYKHKRHGRKKWKWSVCSATVVSAENESVVFTAGHCVFNHGRKKYWYGKKWIFVPGYRYGVAPFGKFVARDLYAPNGWINSRHNDNYDIGAAVLYGNAGGRSVESAAGSRGIVWNADANQYYRAYGYPAEDPFDGETLWVCVTHYGGDDPNSLYYPGPATSVIGCDQTGGSSGGGWIVSAGYWEGYLNGVNSYGYDSEPTLTYGPYFGDAAGNLYNSVRNG
jgi:V8-like Glu-specific endopeptidase